VFTVSFIVLGYLGTIAPSDIATMVAQVCTLLYFAYFVLMPWYTRAEKTKPVPERVTMR
jgi:ubiquinol-cytochrome c reductase cytochrome b subunit